MDSQRSAIATKKNIVAAVEKVAERLGNTVAVCRKCYIHPAVIDTYVKGTLTRPPSASTLSRKERIFASMLKKWATPKRALTMEQALVKSVHAARKK